MMILVIIPLLNSFLHHPLLIIATQSLALLALPTNNLDQTQKILSLTLPVIAYKPIEHLAVHL